MYLIIVSVLVFVSGHGYAENVEVFQLINLINNLQTEVVEMRKSRIEDTMTIRNLQEQIRRYGISGPSHKLSPLDKFNEGFGFDSWKNEVGKNLDTSHFQSSISKTNRRLRRSFSSKGTETESLQHELVRLSKQVEDMNVQPLDSNQVTVRWLQRTVEGIRQEMREIAAAVNTSAVLADKQETATQVALLRSDVVALGHDMGAARVDRERHSARLDQLSQEMQEMRHRWQEAAGGQQKLLIEVETLKEELREQVLIAKKKNFILDASKEFSGRGIRSHNAEHLRFRHSHWKVEVENLQEAVKNLEFSQAHLNKQLQVLIKHQAAQLVKLSTVERNQSEQIDSEKTITDQRLDTLENLVNKTEEQTLNIQSRVNNITSSGIQKLHGSTMELFNALERLESSYDRKTADIRKEISKLDSNLSQTQSDLEELKERGFSSEEQLKSDIIGLQSDVKSNHVRILLVQNSVRNRTGQEAKLFNLESQIKSLNDHVGAEKMEIEALHKQMMADEKELSQWEKGQRKVRESILEFNRIKRHQEEVDQKLNMLLAEFPKDCSGNSSLENLFDSRPSGSYLIQGMDGAAIRVYCDMDTAGGHWTLIQKRRAKGTVRFDRDWAHYKAGFGDEGDFWIGNEMLHHITTTGQYALRMDMWDSLGRYKFAEYTTFQVLGEQDNYRLVLAGYRGNASDAMSYHNGMAFSTPDRDNDASVATHCADFYQSGWWYNHCQYVNVNGRTGITWYDIEGQEWSELAKVEMKIKPKALL